MWIQKPTRNAADVARDMCDLDVGFMPVVKDGRTAASRLHCVTAEGLNPMRKLMVDAYYSPNPVSIGPDADKTPEAAALMSKDQQIRR